MRSIDDCKCVLVTGATSGIGRALALAIASLPTSPKVIGAGRRSGRLEQLAQAGLDTVHVDLDTDKLSLKRFADDIIDKYPQIDAIILCAGVQHEFDFHNPVNIDNLISETNINYTSVITLISYFLPHFLKLSEQGRPTFVIPVTSGLAITPAPWVLSYAASKAALHSFTLSLRVQLRNTNINVIEIVPPLVESELHDEYGTTEKLSKFWMSLDEYTRATMEGLRKGDDVVSCGGSLDAYKRFEKDKEEIAVEMQKRREKW
ncbi:hypothetical protein AMATHDRAFT_72427 [Amanita thiersii Skay4041]|uniref:NAD(P)-binding protein n=1 Tax=Amanita thiersii Skay4041 TaxID=703135 RepID=A0A2A9P0T3_9AGAR|nr:hypothetical protein AMATHDRAFT_72427 [Amanita thiersii Skay4041]